MHDHTTMRIVRTTLLGLAGRGAAGWLSASLMAGAQAASQASHHLPMPSKGMMTRDQKIAGTPYAHIMAPITASTMSARSVK